MELTPTTRHRLPGSGRRLFVKWDDSFEYAGIRGGKVRACLHLATGATGLITASARKSPQAQIVARIANSLGIPARLHMPRGADTPEMTDVRAHGGEIVQHKAGYNNVIIRRATDDVAARAGTGWVYIPFGMESTDAMECTVPQVASIAALRPTPRRVVVVVGSGMTACAILHGLRRRGLPIPVVGVSIGANPRKRIARHAPPFWWEQLTLIDHVKKQPYHEATHAHIDGRVLDPIYEAKCLEYLEDGDLFWVVGIRTGL